MGRVHAARVPREGGLGLSWFQGKWGRLRLGKGEWRGGDGTGCQFRPESLYPNPEIVERFLVRFRFPIRTRPDAGRWAVILQGPPHLNRNPPRRSAR